MRRKHDLKKSISFILSLAMVFTMSVTYMPSISNAADESVENQVSNNKSSDNLTKQTETTSEQAEDNQISDKQNTNNKIEKQNKSLKSVSSGEDSLKLEVATEDGFKDVDSAEINHAATWAIDSSGQIHKQIRITPTFSEVNESKTRTLTVTIPKGMKIIEYTAKSGVDVNGVTELALSQTNDNKLDSSDLTALDGTDFTKEGVKDLVYTTDANKNVNNFNWRTYEGKVVYTFNSNADNIPILFTLDADQSVLPNKTSSYTVDNITASMISGDKILDDYLTPTISNISNGDVAGGQVSTTGVVDTSDEQKGTYPAFNTSVYFNRHGAKFYAKDIVYTATYPEGLDLDYIRMANYNGPGGNNISTSGTYTNGHLIYTHDEATRTVTIEFKNVMIYGWTGIVFYFKSGEIDGTNIKWSENNDNWLTINGTLVQQTGEYLGTEDIQTRTDSLNMKARFQKPITSLNVKGSNKSRSDLNKDNNSPYLYTYSLDGWGVYSDGTTPIEDAVFTFEFADNLFVKEVTIPPTDNRTMKVTVWTNLTDANGRTYNELLPVDGTQHDSIGKDGLELKPNEYIKKLVVNFGEMPKDYTNLNDAYNTMPFRYIGKFIDGQEGDAKLTISASNLDTPVSATTHAKIATSGSSGDSMITNIYNDPNYTASLKKSFNPGDTMYFKTELYNGATGDFFMNSIVNPNFFIRLPEGIDLNLDSVNVLAVAGNKGDERVKLNLTDTFNETDDNGIKWTIYKFEPKEKWDIMTREYGAAKTDTTNYSHQIFLYYTAKISPACRTYAQLNTRYLCFADVAGNSDYTYTNQDYVDISNWASKGVSYKLRSSLTQTYNVSIYQKPDLITSLGIRVLGSGDAFGTYNETDSSIVPVTPDLPAEVKLTWQNTSSEKYYAGSSIYLPIPKKDVDYDHFFNNIDTNPTKERESTGAGNKDTQWTGVLTGPVNLSGFTSYYTTSSNVSTNYTDNAIDNSWIPYTATWKTENQMSASDYKDVTMIKFVALNDIPSVGSVDDLGNPTDTGSVTFELDVSEGAELGQLDYWRTYQKGWTDATGSGTWNYGAVVAATPAMAGVQGKVFYDKNQNGKMDSGEEYTNLPTDPLTGYTTNYYGMLTEKDNKITPLKINIEPDGSFKSLNSSGGTYYLKEGDYTLTFYNNLFNKTDNTRMKFTDETSDVSSSYKDANHPDEGVNWYMDIAQDKIADDASTASMEFSVTKDSLMTKLVGVGLNSYIYKINAENFSYGVIQDTGSADKDSESLDLNDLFYYAHISMTDKNGEELSLNSDNISVDENQLKVLNDAIASGNGALGTYDITFTNKYNTSEETSDLTKTITVTLKDAGSKMSDASNFISGNGIVLGIDEGNITFPELLYRSQVDGWTSDGKLINRADYSVDITTWNNLMSGISSGTVGEYPVTINYADGDNDNQITIPVTLKQHGSGVLPSFSTITASGLTTNGTIAANDFVIGKSDILDDNSSKTLGEVNARDLFANIYDVANLLVDGDQMSYINSENAAGKSGQYPLTYYTPKGETITVNVTLYNHDTTGADGSKLFANDFTYNLQEKALNPLNEDLAKELSKVYGFNSDKVNTSLSDISLNPDDWQVIMDNYNANKTGIFNLGFTDSYGNNVIIKVTLIDKKDVPDNQNSGNDGNNGNGNGKTKVVYKTKTITKNNYITKLVSTVKTGDLNNVIGFSVLLLGAALASVVLIRIKKRKEN
ncbi:MAG: hypothetical protein LBM02_04770 [Lachnospiraceae bacterium]|jgi:hypothetical protein|nr:hypothetical protein [Lachnospiraceae bacterium]